MDPVYLALGFAPLGLYLIWLGIVHWRRRPMILSGTTDNTLLAMAVVGLLIVGPMEFLFPAVMPIPGVYVWSMMLVCYSLLITLFNLLARPRLIIMKIGIESLRGALAEAAKRMDGRPQWAGDSLVLPDSGIQLHLEDHRWMRTVSLVAIGARQSESGWSRLRNELATHLRGVESADRARGYLLAGLGVLFLAWPSMEAAALGGPIVAQRLADLLRL
jgi:hypothetical protein